ncbi:MAG: phage integrase SAM-like domain-containing protein, partial [Clostridia bacterium]|nr:phage integrase SAM-like domain-containing protein [Clostridia bacterium]
MKVTAFIRKTAAKNNVTDLARVYFRVRDKGGVDIKAASELSISPNHWSAERQGYKPRVALVSEEKRMNFDMEVQRLTHLIAKEYHRGVDGTWLQELIEEYHHPGINAGNDDKEDRYLLSYQIQKYIDETPLARESQRYHLDNLNKVLRYERFHQDILHQRGFHLRIDTLTANDIRDFKLWMQEEYRYVDKYPEFYKNETRRNVEQKRSENSMSEILYHFRTVIKWCIRRGVTKNNPFDQYHITQPMYGDPFYLTLEERDKVYYADLSGLSANYPVYRDIFMFQCLIGCRVSDLNRLTKANVVDGCVEYIPQKTKHEHANTVRVPLNRKAQDILDRHKDLKEILLPRFSTVSYNEAIKKILKYVGINRMVRVLDPKTREDVSKPLYEVASSHTARKTFIGN